MRLKRKFFNRDTLIVAKKLLGKHLVRKIGGKKIVVRITETEAYCKKDLACHASRGLTSRTKVMFGPPGHAYVYMIYGMYHCLNMVTERENYPAAVLIRGACLIQNSKFKILKGPGILCRELKIDKKLNGIDITKSRDLWIEEGEQIRSSQIKKGKRIGVDYAGKWKDKLWRFWIL